jgi:hypothetical protein
MRANVAGPSLELLEWPTSRLTRPIRLFRLADERATLLREQVPAREDAAWETAVRLLAWVSARWPHANAHVDEQDAVEILRLVEKGKRFACVEYSTVLSQALNAFGIPARVVNLYTDDYHVGLGKGHVVSEAWIDGRDDWVVFDGQNGMYWTDEDGGPLGVPTLQDRFRSGRRPAAHVTVGPKPVRDPDAELWWRYFAHASPTGATWAGTSFVPTFQSEESSAPRSFSTTAPRRTPTSPRSPSAWTMSTAVPRSVCIRNTRTRSASGSRRAAHHR